MYKKIIAILLSCVMLVSISPAVAAADAPAEPKPTVEEILNEYHRQSFEALFSTETDAATYSNRSGDSSNSLEQETVDALTSAGYSAYNVTTDNYASLEALLETDFEQMGLQKDSSYIIVIGGDELVPSSQSQSRVKPGPMQDIIDDGGSSMEYTYNGNTYELRYMIVAPTDDPLMNLTVEVDLLAPALELVILENVLNATISFMVDRMTSPVPTSTILAALGIQFLDFTPEATGEAFMYGTAKWTQLHTQVWSNSLQGWFTGSIVEYATVNYDFAITSIEYGDATVDDPEEEYFAVYTDHYNDITWRKREAVIGFLYANINREVVGDIDIYINDKLAHTFCANF